MKNKLQAGQFWEGRDHLDRNEKYKVLILSVDPSMGDVKYVFYSNTCKGDTDTCSTEVMMDWIEEYKSVLISVPSSKIWLNINS